MHNAPVKKARGTRNLLENVAANLYRHRENGSYYGMKKIGGRRSLHALETKDRFTAKAKLRDWLGELEDTDPGNADLTLAGLLEKYQSARTDIAPATKVGEAGRIASFRALFPRPMDTLVARVRNSDLAAWLGVVGQKNGEPKRASTRNQNRAFVRALFDFAVADRAIAQSPFDEKICRKARRDPIKRVIPTEDEFESLVAEIRKPGWKKVSGQHGGQRPMFQHESADFAEFLGLAGVGQAEAIGLTWQDMDFATGTIHYVRKKTKTAFSTPVYPWLKPLVEKLRGQAGPNPHGPVFKMQNVRNSLGSACERLGFPHFTQRSLRAMRIKRLWEAGVDVKIIAQWQGHRDGGKLIMSIYTEVFGSSTASYESTQLAKAALVFAASRKSNTAPVKKKSR
jgi:integrase